MHSWCLLQTVPSGPAFVMALDEALWKQPGETFSPCVHIHRFDSECLTLGFSQPWRDVERAGLAHRPWTRRVTGGGAIHHRPGGLSFSLIGLDPPPGRRPGPIACTVGQLLADLARRLGVSATVLAASRATTLGAPLCADRRCAGDVVADENKIAGIGQRLREGRLLVQCALMRIETDAGVLGHLVEALRHTLGIAPEPAPLPAAVLAGAEALVRERYANPRWNCRR